MTINRNSTFFGADGYGFVSSDTDGIEIAKTAAGITVSPGVTMAHSGAFSAPVLPLSRNGYSFYDDFTGPQWDATQGRFWTPVVTGTASVTERAADQTTSAQIGIVQLQTSSASGSSSSLRLGDGNERFRLQSWDMVEQSWVIYNQTSGSASNRFDVNIGLNNNADDRSIFFYWQADGGADNIIARVKNGAGTTDVDTGLDRFAAFDPRCYTIRYESANYWGGVLPRVLFSIDDRVVTTISNANIPNGAADLMRFTLRIAGTAGTGTEGVCLDAFALNAIGSRYNVT